MRRDWEGGKKEHKWRGLKEAVKFLSITKSLHNIFYFNVDDDIKEEAILSGGLDLIVVPGLGFTKVLLIN